jgi:hypothetical protein
MGMGMGEGREETGATPMKGCVMIYIPKFYIFTNASAV